MGEGRDLRRPPASRSPAVAEKVGVLTATEEFFARRPTGADADTFRRYVAGAPDAPPQPGDRLDD
ncbi:hypothetical protein [Caenispirillum bisanense]|uniref:Uncharacterized protein n=1 Tax=Caenispirillum bisanense TaxID=414052 RepID=A0A286G3E6_9PROT|nr:hypothetical protein [Caenispirillum bisanense]SOD90013.1 hypothetical protein SAMN05421508_101411 [Caenispirillum bisanense]